MKYRHRVLTLLFTLSTITYLDRVCISVAGPRMQADLQISPQQWGWVLGIFAIAYAVFEIPSGALGDRIGPRKVLTRIVIWWSVFTSLTGTVSSFLLLLPARFLFGAGEAGAYPNTSASISRWFPARERGRAQGLIFMASRVGGAISPFLVIPLQVRFGWRASFFCFGFLGIIWAIVWYRWYRDDPAAKAGVTEAELKEIGTTVTGTHHGLPWKLALRSSNLWALVLMYFTYCYGAFFFLSWMPTYLARGRSYGEQDLLFTTLPFIVGAAANGLGGMASDTLVQKLGLRWGRRTIAIPGLLSAAGLTVACVFTDDKALSMVFLALSYAASDFMCPSAWAVCLDIGGKNAGAVSATMNTAGQLGSFVSSVLFGYLVVYSGELLPRLGLPVQSGLRDFRYDVPLLSMAVMLTISALLWLKIDPTREITPQRELAAAGIGNRVSTARGSANVA